MDKIRDQTRSVKDTKATLELLKAGNQRYVKNRIIWDRDYEQTREDLSNDQHPFATIVCCSDSRVSPEIFFDCGLGDLFVIRNAGNVVDETTLGSIEYTSEHLESPLIVVCGHSKCGAVTAACDDGAEFPANLQTIIDSIQPAIDMGGDVDQVIHNNIDVMVDIIKNNDTVKKFHQEVIGAYYDIDSGVVTFSNLT